MKKPKFRILKTNKGYIVEYLHYGFLKNKWKPYITYSGLDEAYPYESEQRAKNDLLCEISKQIRF